METTEEQLTSQDSTSSSFPVSFWLRFLYGSFVVILPVFNFSLVKLLIPEWQSGKFSDYITLFLSAKASLLFFPLLAYSIVCYILLLVDADRYAKSFIIRFGIYTGTFLALQYSILTILSLELSLVSLLVLLAYFSPFIITRLYLWLTAKWNATLVANIALGIGVAVLLTFMILRRDVLSPFIFMIFFFGIAAPFWSFLIAGQAALWLFKNHESKLTFVRGLGLVAWLASYSYVLRFNILKMYELYAALPPKPPDCYIATAAAKGHPRFVRSRLNILSNGKQMTVNAQLQRLKFAELALKATYPVLHKALRGIYDVLGKFLAQKIKNPFLADISYLLLKPFELISFWILSRLVPEACQITSKIYVYNRNK